MIEKEFTPKRTVCRVTFRVPEDWASDEVSVVGDFNDWDPDTNRMEVNNGYWETLLRLKPNRDYKFRYLLDGERWENDDEADDYVSNPFGTDDSVLKIGK